jgi:hemerythrin-like metal-binding protein
MYKEDVTKMNNNLHNQEKANITTYLLLHHNILINWQPSYELGIPIIDEQHRGVVTIINSLFYGMQHKHAENILTSIISMIRDYTHIHFTLEEDFLMKCNFPDLDSHQLLHKELIGELFHTVRASSFERDPYKFMDFLKRWWIDHICNKDRQFRDYLLKEIK